MFPTLSRKIYHPQFSEKWKAAFLSGFERMQGHFRRQAYHKRAKALFDRSALAFTEHPAQTKESYGQHLWFTMRMSLQLVGLGIAMLVHGLFPFLFTRTVSCHFEKIYLIMRGRIPEPRRTVLEDEYEI